MRTIGFLLIGSLLLPLGIVQDRASLTAGKIQSSFIIPSIQPVFSKLSANTADTASLKESSWYANAVGNIEESEYRIKYDEATQSYASPNRKQGLRSFYSAKTFSLLSRNDSANKWRLELTTKGVYANNKLIYAPDENATVTESDKSIQFNHHDNFTTEYINSKEGVRQNFIIQKEPAEKPQALSIRLQANKGWFVNKVHDKEIHFAKIKGDAAEKKLTYNDLKVWDADHKELSAHFEIKKAAIEIIVDVKNAMYPITIDPISTTAAATLEMNQVGAFGGYSVSSAGDVNSDGYSDVIVGAYYYDNGQFNEGAALIYHGSATGVSSTPATLLEINQADANFGISVSTAGDVNADGYSDVIIGAWLYSNGQSNEGAAFVFHGSSTGINPVAISQMETNQATAWGGYSVSAAGDVNADGYSDVIMGAIEYDNSELNEGVAFIYLGSAAGIVITPSSQIESNEADARAGYSMASAGDVNGDGYSDVIIGIPDYDNGQVNEGVALIFHGGPSGIIASGNPSNANSLLQSNQVNASLGNAVSSAGDVNGDGYSDVIIGALFFDNGQTDEGAAFIYMGSAAGLSTTAAAQLESNQASAYGGSAVSCGDVNGDGYSDIFVGAYFYDNPEANEGAVFIYNGSSAGIITIPSAQLEINQV
ncbi:MAG TPA: integrin alpha, partial [Chitinophagaceae bacterium]|nr:integrin alpha [Chitinophagaceae bacterium]